MIINPGYERPARTSRMTRDAAVCLGRVSYGYDAALGVRISRDPLAEAGGLNLYVFGQNNSIHQLDALGLCSPKDYPQSYQDKDGNITDKPTDSDGNPNKPIPKAEPVGDPVAETSGKLNYDEHGADTGHKTSGAIDDNGNIVPPGTPGSRPLNSTDDFAVAPGGSGANIGDTAQVTYPDGTTSTHQVGDIGPKNGEPEISPGAGKNDGLDVGTYTDKKGNTQIYPTQNGSSDDIPVTIKYYRK